MRAMCDEFTEWLTDIGGVAECHRRVNSYLEARGSDPLTHEAVRLWKVNGIPLERIPLIEAISGISRYTLAPEFFGEPPPSAA